MTAKISASADGTKVNIGNAAEDALQIDSTAKTIKAVAPYLLFGTEVVTATGGIGIKFPDGTLICLVTSSLTPGAWAQTSPAGGAYSQFGGLNQYAVQFIAVPKLMGWCNDQFPGSRGMYVSNLTSTVNGCTGGFFVSPVPTASGTGAMEVTVLAYGRWKA